MNKILNKTIKGLRNLYTMQGKSADEIESLIGQFITNYEKSKEPQLVKSVPAPKTFVNCERLKELISDNDLESLKLLVKERDEARGAVKTASVGDYIVAVIAANEAVLRVLNFSHQWVQDVPTGLELFKIDDRQYFIKERKNGVKHIGYKTKRKV